MGIVRRIIVKTTHIEVAATETSAYPFFKARDAEKVLHCHWFTRAAHACSRPSSLPDRFLDHVPICELGATTLEAISAERASPCRAKQYAVLAPSEGNHSFEHYARLSALTCRYASATLSRALCVNTVSASMLSAPLMPSPNASNAIAIALRMPSARCSGASASLTSWRPI